LKFGVAYRFIGDSYEEQRLFNIGVLSRSE
jgi:hypothetical protein